MYRNTYPGAPLKITSNDFNAMQGFIRSQKQPAGFRAPKIAGARLAQGVIVRVLNTSSHAYEALDPIHYSLEDIAIGPDDNEAEFQTSPALQVDDSVASSRCRGHWGICLDPIAAQVEGESFAGRVLLSGVTVARVIKRESDDLFVDTGGDEEPPEVEEGEDEIDLDFALSTRGVGAASILWIDPDAEDDEETWAVIQCHGYRVSDLEYWGVTEDDLYTEEHDTYGSTMMTLQDGREVRARCRALTGGGDHYIPGGSSVLAKPDAITGLWDVRLFPGCLTPVPEEEEE